jgi:predicted DNA-binding WGR domain protein
MKNVYLENTNNHHDKFYHMIENKDGASFTASWGRTGSNGRTQIYGMNEWDMKYREKINKGYKDTTIVPPSSNWIQGMSVAQRKKQGITTVQPLVRPKKVKKKPKAIKKTAKKIHYDVGQVNVEINRSQQNKLRILHMTMHNWEKNNGQLPMDSQQGRSYEGDLLYVEELVDKGLSKKAERDKDFLTQEEMLDMNVLFKTYGGKRVTQ